MTGICVQEMKNHSCWGYQGSATRNSASQQQAQDLPELQAAASQGEPSEDAAPDLEEEPDVDDEEVEEEGVAAEDQDEVLSNQFLQDLYRNSWLTMVKKMTAAGIPNKVIDDFVDFSQEVLCWQSRGLEYDLDFGLRKGRNVHEILQSSIFSSVPLEVRTKHRRHTFLSMSEDSIIGELKEIPMQFTRAGKTGNQDSAIQYNRLPSTIIKKLSQDEKTLRKWTSTAANPIWGRRKWQGFQEKVYSHPKSGSRWEDLTGSTNDDNPPLMLTLYSDDADHASGSSRNTLDQNLCHAYIG